MIKKFLPSSIRGKIMAVTAAITVLIAVITMAVCYSVFQSFLMKNQIQSTEFNLSVVSSNMAEDMKETVTFTKWCCSNSEVGHYLERLKDQPKLPTASKDIEGLRPLALTAYKRLNEEYITSGSAGGKKYMARVIISTPNTGNFLQSMTSANYSSSFDAARVSKSSFFAPLFESPDFRWIGVVDDPISNANHEKIIPIVRPVYDEYSLEIIGWTYVEVSSRLFTDYLASYPQASDSQLFLTIGDKTYGSSSSTWSDPAMPYTDFKPVTGTATLDSGTQVFSVVSPNGEKRMLVRRPVEVEGADGWYLSQVLSRQQFNQQRVVYLLLIVGISAAIISLGCLLTILLNKIISQPIRRLSLKIDAIADGDFSRDSEIEWNHELGSIGRGINNMSENIVTLMDKRVADEKQKKDLEYQILQSQINPHFLYNTLNSIKWMATIQNATGIADMTTALARLLKSVSKGTSSMVTLREELDLVKDYFLIQQYRYGGSITMDYHIESEELYGCEIHRFTLQPIIENALFHGIEPKGTAGAITVSAESGTMNGKKVLKISVTDNGIGMTRETIDSVLHEEDNPGKNKTDFFRHVGISNVNRRIQYDFGPEYGITIVSEPGVYTTMTIVRPYINQSERKKDEDLL